MFSNNSEELEDKDQDIGEGNKNNILILIT